MGRTFEIETKSVFYGCYGADWSDIWERDDAQQSESIGLIWAEHFGDYYYCRRTILAWDTSSIPDDEVIYNAKIRFYIPGAGAIRHAGDPTMFLGLCPSLAETPEPLDYGRMKDDWTLASESVAVSGLIPDQYNEINLITAGINNINKAGWTKFSLRSSIDLAGIQPNAIYAYLYFQLTVAQGNPCQLVVNYPEDPGYIWDSDEAGETTEFHYIGEDCDERAIEGEDTGEDGDPGYVGIGGVAHPTYYYYLDANGDLRWFEGTKEGATGKVPQQMAINGTKFCYIDDNGDERRKEGILVE